jgi:hypothetical protein
MNLEHERFLANLISEDEIGDIRYFFDSIARDHASKRVLKTHKPHEPKLYLGDYLASEAQPPSMVHRGLFKGYSDSLGNATWGDCGDAMSLHGIEGMNHAAGNAIPPFVTPDALGLYSVVSGFNVNAGPAGNNPTDTGTDNAALVAYLQSTGVTCTADGSVHRFGVTVDVNPTDDVQCQIAVYEFAALFCAWALPLTAQSQKTWSVVGDGKTGQSAPASWGYHDTVSLAYTGTTFDIDTWGLWTPVLKDFRDVYHAGSFVTASQDMLGRTGVSPSGLDWTALNKDIAALNSGNPIQ